MGLGLRAAARELGISHPALKKAADRGRVPRLSDGTFDVDACRVALSHNTNLGKQRSARSQQRAGARKPPEPPVERSACVKELPPRPPVPDEADPQKEPDGTYTEASRQREWIRLERDRLALERERKQLIELAPINAYVAGMIIKARDELMRMGPELRDRLAQETDPIACEAMLNNRVGQVLAGMSEFHPEAE
jgi:hypothetical protein